MRKLLFSAITIIVVSFAYILLTAQKVPDNRKFYYAFAEKIYLTEVPNKYLVKVNSSNDAEILTSTFRSLIAKQGKGIIRQKDNCLLIEVEDATAFMTAVKNAGSKVSFTRQCYKYQQTEMFYSDEIIVVPLPGKRINDIISKLNLSYNVLIKNKKFKITC